MSDQFFCSIVGKVFGKKDYRERKSDYGTQISFNLESKSGPLMIGDKKIDSQKVTLFPSFNLPTNKTVPPCIKRDALITGTTSIFTKASNKEGSASKNASGYREDVLTNLDYGYSTIFDYYSVLGIQEEEMGSICCGAMKVFMSRPTLPKFNVTGTIFLLYQDYMVPNVGKDDPDLKYKKFRKRYIRAYSPNLLEIKDHSHVICSGRVINHPFIEKDVSPFLYLDKVIHS